MSWETVSCLITDVGCVRKRNEDAGGIVQPHDTAVLASRGVLAIVADGMGGHSAGEIASQLAVEHVRRAYYRAEGSPDIALETALSAANRAILERAQKEPRLAGMGTTCVTFALCGGMGYAAHVGDSRLYLVRGGGIYQMTNDDSAVGEMVKRGLISRTDARRHEERNVILKALGTRATLDVSTWPQPFPVRPGDAFLLCSDGLTDAVEDEELLDAVQRGAVDQSCRELVALAKSRGGHDNITVAVLRIAPRPVERTLPDTREVQVPS